MNDRQEQGETMRKNDVTPDSITFEGVEYVPAGTTTEAPSGDYVIVRSDRAGVFAGHLIEHDRANQVVVLRDAIRLWRWAGFTLSEVARDGAIDVAECKYGVAVAELTVATVIEVIPATDAAMLSIKGVKPLTREAIQNG